jgi:hypothetical protein
MFFGIGLHIIVAIYFAIHCVRTGRQIFWLFILFSFPLVGSLVYFIVEYLPDLRMGKHVSRASTVAARALDPNRDLREARSALDMTPTAQNRLNLAHALLASGETQEACEQFDLCLAGPFAQDPEIRFAAAKAKLLNGQSKQAEGLLYGIREEHPDFRCESLAIALSQALMAEGKTVEAGEELRTAEARFGGIEARAEYAIWAARSGDLATAHKLREELEKSWSQWSSHSRSMNRPLIKRVDEAIASAPSA